MTPRHTPPRFCAFLRGLNGPDLPSVFDPTLYAREIEDSSPAAGRIPQAPGPRRRAPANGWIGSDAHFALKRLARHYGATKQELIERLAVAEEDRILTGIELDSPEWNAHFGVTR